jgi:replication factor A1
MTAEQMIDLILSGNSGVSKEELVERLANEKRKTNGLISDEILLRMIAAEFGLEAQDHGVSMPTLSVADLVPSLGNVTVVGRVVAVFPPRTFDGNRSGRFASFLIADKSGILRVVLWNDKASLMESGEIKVKQIVRVSHGYTKEGYGGKVELHIGDKCTVEINPQGANAVDFPAISRFTTKIGEISSVHSNKRVNIVGRVKELSSTSTFERQDMSQGRVMRFVLADETGEISVVAWNEKADELESLESGTELEIVDTKVKRTLNEGMEIHVDAGTYTELLPATDKFLKIADLREQLKRVNVEGEIATKPMLRDVKTSKEEIVKLASFELRDNTGRIWVSTWREHASTIGHLKVGDRIVIRDAYVKKGFGDHLEISTRDATSIAVAR